ncbi:unnamed protein product [Rangifer tarandus platyrhynchus]|uniref:Uncharacterized protein n=1 Tax=Rangifer tarandus platyrhynchus TaxID=3082113 RepID=A0AC59YWP8_RANTA
MLSRILVLDPQDAGGALSPDMTAHDVPRRFQVSDVSDESSEEQINDQGRNGALTPCDLGDLPLQEGQRGVQLGNPTTWGVENRERLGMQHLPDEKQNIAAGSSALLPALRAEGCLSILRSVPLEPALPTPACDLPSRGLCLHL